MSDIALLGYFLAFFGLAFVWPTVRVWRRDGVNALMLPHDDSAAGVAAAGMRVVIAALVLLLTLRAAGVPDAAIGIMPWLQHPAFVAAGSLMLPAALLWIIVAQAQMGRSWRIGIDTGDQPPLVRHGLFARSRNPIFLGMRIAMAGLFLVLPSAPTLALLVAAEVLIQVQVRLEEVHLASRLGDPYRAYFHDVPRWL
ncbi:MAG: isoprenylcysteine carboxylmethyltransferase family protein [Alphaproteobacteria bacterium]|nr:isoprenylcysteine carboxylmethyltransferase family protein [Alphaproteobacteria bacterium]